jgi:hypothetical protein
MLRRCRRLTGAATAAVRCTPAVARPGRTALRRGSTALPKSIMLAAQIL